MELKKAIKTTHADTPISLSTGHLGVEDGWGFEDIRITGFIQKPWTAEELTRRIQDLDEK